MKRWSSLLVMIVLMSSILTAQNLSTIFNSVDTVWPGGLPGDIISSDTAVKPIISTSLCYDTNLSHYAVAKIHQNGRVVSMAHEGILSNNSIVQVDNEAYLVNVIEWLSTGNQSIKLKQGWINGSNSSTLQTALAAKGFSFSTIGALTSSGLSNTDVLILGNDWNGTQAYTASELTAIDNFVSNGGGLLIVGLGWSWPSGLNQYPMNQVSKLFGFEFTTNAIYDNVAPINGYPTFSNFYPNNIDTNYIPLCAAPFFGTNLSRGDTLRVLKLAVSTTGEYTQQLGGVNATINALDDWLEDINDIYGREYCVRFELVSNNNQLIFADANTDPWGTLPAGSGGCTNASIILNQQASVIDGIIGAANYDLSHVIAGSPYGGGCAGSFKRGLSGGFNIPVTRHEIGHQFSQSHTINFGNRNNYEPENGGWTIQGGNGQGHGHGVSFHQLAENLRTNNANKGTKIPTNNTIPTVDAGPDVFIPISTPFELKGIATDPDVGDSLTYVWDNMDKGFPQTIPFANDLQGALFMRLLPSASSSRTIPRMSEVVANNNVNFQEQLPTQPRQMPIRLTVNDNHKMMYNGELINASGTNSDDIMITVADAGPFVVTSQNTNSIQYNGGSVQQVTWDVNGTDIAPINTQQVKISLSTDGGYTYPTVLLSSTSNTGAASVVLPNINTTTARIKVEATNSIYFDINTHNFEIVKDTTISTQQQIAQSIKVFPNPANDYIEITSPNQQQFFVRVLDMNGRVLKTLNYANRIDISDIVEGTYIVELSNADYEWSVTKKIVIIR